MKVYCLYDDGVHIDCFPSLYEAEYFVEVHGLEGGLSRYTDIEEEDFDPKCDCKCKRISLEGA